MKLSFFALIFLSLFLGGCKESNKEALSFNAEKVIDTVVYVKHPVTQLCFAVVNADYSYVYPTNVPCTPEVLAEIEKNHERK